MSREAALLIALLANLIEAIILMDEPDTLVVGIGPGMVRMLRDPGCTFKPLRVVYIVLYNWRTLARIYIKLVKIS
jgi:hypothetical protein